MSVDAALFGDDEPQSAPDLVFAPTPIASWQVDLLRKALDGRGLEAMVERQQLIEQLVGRPVASLRGLTADEALRILSTLGKDDTPRTQATSLWDSREEDTWIDRL